MRHISIQSLRRHRQFLSLAVVISVLGALLAFAVTTGSLVVESAKPELEAKGSLLAETVSSELNRASEIGIPLAKLPGISVFLDDIQVHNREMLYAIVLEPSRGILASTTSFATDANIPGPVRDALTAGLTPSQSSESDVFNLKKPFLDATGRAYELHIGIDARLTRNSIQEIRTDVAITLFVALIITIEVLLLVFAMTVDGSRDALTNLVTAMGMGDFSGPAPERGQDPASRVLALARASLEALNTRYDQLKRRVLGLSGSDSNVTQARQALDGLERQFRFAGSELRSRPIDFGTTAIRFPLFVFFFAIDMSRPFWPIYVGQFPSPFPSLDANTLIALPMALWGVTMMIATPWAHKLTNRFGVRTTLLAGMVPASIGSIMCGSAGSFLELLFWRAFTAAGFGIVTLAALLFLTAAAPIRKSARNVAIFVGAQTAAGVCGAAIGGMMADQLGYRWTLIMSGAIVALNCSLVWRLTRATTILRQDAKDGGSYRNLLSRGRVLFFVALGAMPARLVFTGFLLYTVPLALHQTGYSDAAIGRVMMLYFIISIVLTPLVARLLERFECHRLMLMGGSFCLGIAMLLFSQSGDMRLLLGSMAFLGLGMALISTAQIAVLPLHFAPECQQFGQPSVMALFRMVERAGSIAGPLVASAIATLFGFVGGTLVMGVGLLSLTAGLILYFAFTTRPLVEEPAR